MPDEEVILDPTPPEDPPAEDPPAEDPPAEDPPAEDPPAEDPPAEEPARFTKRMAEKTFQMHEQRRRAEAAEAEVARMRQEAGANERPTIPEVDPYDEGFVEKMAERDKAIAAAAAFDAQQAFAQQQARQQAFAQQQAQQSKQHKTLQTYTDRATKLGITPEQLQVAGNAVDAYGVHPEVEDYILHADDGPLLTAYLADHPGEIETLQGLRPSLAVVRVATELASKAKAAGGRSTAPPPPDTLGGGGAPPSDEGPPGATYE